MSRKKLMLMPQCGEWVIDGARFDGCMLVRDVPDQSGQWWVGGKQVALVKWRDRSARGNTLPKLYRLVRRAVLDNTPNGEAAILASLLMNNDLSVMWAPGEGMLQASAGERSRERRGFAASA